MPNSATFAGTDTTTLGAWSGVYGADGYAFPGTTYANSLPGYASGFGVVRSDGAAADAVDLGTGFSPAYPQDPSDPSAIRHALIDYDSLGSWVEWRVDVGATARQLALYLWDYNGTRTLQVDVRDGGTGGVLDGPRTVAGDDSGVWYVWNVTGSVRLRVAQTAGSNPVSTALLFDPSSSPLPPPGLAAGVASFTGADASVANVTCTAASGGTAPVASEWRVYDFGSGWTGTGQATLSAALTGLTAGVEYYASIHFADAAAATADSNVIAVRLWGDPVSVGAVVGDSIYAGFGLSAGQDPVTGMVAELPQMTRRKVSFGANTAASGSKTADWLPAAGTGYLAAAEAAANTASATVIPVFLGHNDARAGVAAGTYGANLAAIVAHLFAAVGTLQLVVVHYPLYSPDTLAASPGNAKLLVDYQAQIDALDNGTTVRRGDRLAHSYFMAYPDLLQSDGLHPTAAGAAVLGRLHAKATADALDGAAGGGASQSIVVGGGW